MRKARKKPVEISYLTFRDLVIDYEKPNYGHKSQYEELYSKMQVNRYRETVGEHIKEFVINTLEGDMTMTDKDVLIIGVRGEIYPCKIDIFEQTYDVLRDGYVGKIPKAGGGILSDETMKGYKKNE